MNRRFNGRASPTERAPLTRDYVYTNFVPVFSLPDPRLASLSWISVRDAVVECFSDYGLTFKPISRLRAARKVYKSRPDQFPSFTFSSRFQFSLPAPRAGRGFLKRRRNYIVRPRLNLSPRTVGQLRSEIRKVGLERERQRDVAMAGERFLFVVDVALRRPSRYPNAAISTAKWN